MNCPSAGFRRLTLLAVVAALAPVAARAQVQPYSPGSGSITVVNEWQMGEYDSGAAAGGTATTTVNDIGGHNMTAVGSPSYISPANGGLPASTLALSCTGNTLGANSSTAPAQYLTYSSAGTFGSDWGSAIASAGNNWGCDFWFEASGGTDGNGNTYNTPGYEQQLLIIGDYGPNNQTARLCVNIALNNAGGNNGLFVANASGVSQSYNDIGSIAANTWYHLVYVNDAGTGQLYFGSGTLTAADQLIYTPGASQGGINSVNAPLRSLEANITAFARFDSGVANGEYGFNGAIEQHPPFHVNQPRNVQYRQRQLFLTRSRRRQRRRQGGHQRPDDRADQFWCDGVCLVPGLYGRRSNRHRGRQRPDDRAGELREDLRGVLRHHGGA